MDDIKYISMRLLERLTKSKTMTIQELKDTLKRSRKKEILALRKKKKLTAEDKVNLRIAAVLRGVGF